MKVKVNDQQRELNQDSQVVVKESGKPVALVQCDEIRCEILSEKYRVYVSIDNERVAVEVSTTRLRLLLLFPQLIVQIMMSK